MSSFGTVVTSIGVPAGIISIVVAVTIIVTERVRRFRVIRKINNRELKPLGLEKDERGNVRLKELDASIRGIKVQDYVSSSKISQRVNEYFRPLRDVRRLRNLLQAKDIRTPQVDHLRGATLSTVDLSNIDVSGIDFRRADLERANLSGATLTNADLSEANLRRATMSGAELKDADLTSADMSGAILTQEQIEKALGDQRTKLPNHLKYPERWKRDTVG